MAKIPNEHEIRVKLKLVGVDGFIRGTELDLGPVIARTSATKQGDTIVLAVDLMGLKVELAKVLRETADDLELIREEDLPMFVDG